MTKKTLIIVFILLLIISVEFIIISNSYIFKGKNGLDILMELWKEKRALLISLSVALVGEIIALANGLNQSSKKRKRRKSILNGSTDNLRPIKEILPSINGNSKNIDSYNLPYIAKAGFSFKKIIFIVVIVAIILSICVIVRSPYVEGDKSGIIIDGSLITFFILLIFYQQKVIIEEDKIIYKSNEILFENIKRVDVGLTDKHIDAPSINIYDNKYFSKNPFKIPVGIFNRKDMNFLINIMSQKSPNAKIVIDNLE
jgi:hypothetical protein